MMVLYAQREDGENPFLLSLLMDERSGTTNFRQLRMIEWKNAESHNVEVVKIFEFRLSKHSCSSTPSYQT
jgi:hypothetical protein